MNVFFSNLLPFRALRCRHYNNVYGFLHIFRCLNIATIIERFPLFLCNTRYLFKKIDFKNFYISIW